MSRPFVAQYGGRCAAECGQPIREGDLAVYVDDEVVHTDCVDALNDEHSHRRPESPPCARCWTVHAGECM